MPQQTFAHVEALTLNVSRIEVTDVSNAPPLPEDFVVSPGDATVQYFSKKVRASEYASPEHGVLRVDIEMASVEKVHKDADGFIPSKLGFGGLDEYDMKLKIALNHVDAVGDVIYGKTIMVQRRFSISEHSSLAKREEAQLESIEAVFKKVDPEVTSVLLDEMKLGAL